MCRGSEAGGEGCSCEQDEWNSCPQAAHGRWGWGRWSTYILGVQFGVMRAGGKDEVGEGTVVFWGDLGGHSSHPALL